MNFGFYKTYNLAVFVFAESGFAYDSLVRHYDARQATYKQAQDVGAYTTAINDILSTEDLIDPELHDHTKKKKVVQAVMASVIIHGKGSDLSNGLPQPVINPALLNHFKILTLIEKISLGIVDGRYDPEDFRLLKECGGINKATFLDWLSETCIAHNTPDLSPIFKAEGARQQRLKDELIKSNQELEKINSITFDRSTLEATPHHYDGSIAGWVDILWAAFTALKPSNIPTTESVKQKLIQTAKDLGSDWTQIVAARYSALDANFNVPQNRLQQIAGWIVGEGDYSSLVYSLQPTGDAQSAMYDVFFLMARDAVYNLYQQKIKQIEREMAR